MKQVNTVYLSTDYEQFTQIDGNRVVKQNNLNKIIASMKEEQLQIPIIVNQKYEIIDGQHRFEACKKLNLPIYFIVINGYNLAHVHKLNTIGTKWTPEDYMIGYANDGYQNYIELQTFAEKYNIKCAISAALLSGKISRFGGVNLDDFYNGKFKVTDRVEAAMIAKALCEIETYFSKAKSSNFVFALANVNKSKHFDMEVFIKKLKYQQVPEQLTKEQYLITIENIFNYKSRNKVMIFKRY